MPTGRQASVSGLRRMTPSPARRGRQDRSPPRRDEPPHNARMRDVARRSRGARPADDRAPPHPGANVTCRHGISAGEYHGATHSGTDRRSVTDRSNGCGTVHDRCMAGGHEHWRYD